MPQLANILGVLLAAVLIVSAATKLSGGFGRQAASRTALGKMLPERTVILSWRALTVIEVVLALAFVWSRPAVAGVASAVFFAGAAVFAAAALRVDPTASCGCLGLTGQVSWRTIVRALILGVAAAVYATSAAKNFTDTTALAEAALTLVVFVALSPAELKAAGYVLHRLRPAPRCLTSSVSIEMTLSALRSTRIWAEYAAALTAEDPLDSWREGCWQFLCFDGQIDDVEATYAFALRLPPGRSVCRAVLVNNATGEQHSTHDERVRWPRRWQTAAASSHPIGDSLG